MPANVIDTGDFETQMRLSHEIVVLDFGDEQTNPFDFDKPPKNATDFRVSPMDWEEARIHEQEQVYAKQGNDHIDCPERSSVMGLAVACALLVVLYVCTVVCICTRRTKSSTSTKVILPPVHIPGRVAAAAPNSFGLMSHDYVR
jgi:hypothetical protein